MAWSFGCMALSTRTHWQPCSGARHDADTSIEREVVPGDGANGRPQEFRRAQCAGAE